MLSQAEFTAARGAGSPLGDQLAHFLTAAAELGYAEQVRLGMASLVTMRLLILTGNVLTGLTDADIASFDEAITVRKRSCGRPLKHYRTALYATRAVIYHLGAALTPAAAKDTAHLRWEWDRYFEGVHAGIAASGTAYLECACGTRVQSTVAHMAGRLARLRPRHHRHRPGAGLAGGPGPPAAHRAVPDRSRHRRSTRDRRGLAGIGAAQPGPHRRTDDR